MSKDKKLTDKDKINIISGAPADEVAKKYEVDVEIAKAFVDFLKKFPNILFDNHFMKLILLSFQYIQLEVIKAQILEAKRGLYFSEFGDILKINFLNRIKKLIFIKKIKNNFCRKENCQKILVRFV